MINPVDILAPGTPSALRASRHRKTQELRFPPLSMQSPLASEYDTVALPAHGTVYSFSIIHPNPKTGAVPFALGYVDLPGPIRLFGRIAGEGVAIGAACEIAAHPEFVYEFRTIQP